MVLVTVDGTYEDKKIALAELPDGLERARVMGTFLPIDTAPAPQNDSSSAENEAKQRRQEASKRLVTLLERGAHLGGGPYPTR